MRSISLSVLAVLLLGSALATAKPKKKKPVKKATPAKVKPPAPPEEPATPDPVDTKPTTPPTTPPGTPPSTPSVGSGSAAPPASPVEPPPVKESKSDAPDVDSLRQEYLALRDELFKSRARANTVASQLYSTRIQIKLTYTTGRFYNPGKATIRLDGATVYENTNGGIASDDGVRFDGFVAPGRHLVTFRIESTGKDDDSFTSATENQIVVKAVASKDLIVVAKARDSGNIAYEWKKSERGNYGLGLDVSVKTTAHEAKK